MRDRKASLLPKTFSLPVVPGVYRSSRVLAFLGGTSLLPKKLAPAGLLKVDDIEDLQVPRRVTGCAPPWFAIFVSLSSPISNHPRLPLYFSTSNVQKPIARIVSYIVLSSRFVNQPSSQSQSPAPPTSLPPHTFTSSPRLT